MFKKEYFYIFALIGLAIAYVGISLIVLITRSKWGKAVNKKLVVGAMIVTFCAILNTGTPAFAQATDPTPSPTPLYGLITQEPTLAPTPPPNPTVLYGVVDSSVRLDPEVVRVPLTANFSTDVYVNTSSDKLAAYGFSVSFNTSFISINRTLGDYGVEPGPDGYLAASNEITPGLLKITGFDTLGAGPGRNLNFLTIFWTVGSSPGITNIFINIDKFTNLNGSPIPYITTTGTTVIINELALGDVNNDSEVDIIDALLISQYYVELNPPNFYPGVADVDASGNIDIVDALLIAMKFVGLIDKFPGEL